MTTALRAATTSFELARSAFLVLAPHGLQQRARANAQRGIERAAAAAAERREAEEAVAFAAARAADHPLISSW